jgi:EAL domain-containing protein (putative c-di-GMP-specific phosphodiesterase class I)
LEHLNLCSINISGHSLGDQNFLLAVRKTIEESKVPARKLCFDISETAAINNFSGILTLINTLKPLGCRFALDNFGAGIASFTYLKNLPIDFLKIDGALIKDITNDIIDHATVKAINDLAHLMHVPTIAQAVESEEIYLKLKEMEVDYVQGYWLSKPKPLID